MFPYLQILADYGFSSTHLLYSSIYVDRPAKTDKKELVYGCTKHGVSKDITRGRYLYKVHRSIFKAFLFYFWYLLFTTFWVLLPYTSPFFVFYYLKFCDSLNVVLSTHRFFYIFKPFFTPSLLDFPYLSTT